MSQNVSYLDRRERRDIAKRAVDVLGSGLGLLITAPLQLGIATAIRVAMGRPVLFRQKRPGRNGRLFTLIKFRTMITVDSPLVEDGDRLTRLGSILRATSLDELPTLWNVLRGDMSLVGPRPLLVQYLLLYTDDQARRHEVRPGITGLAQVNGRNQLSWDRRFALDVSYVDHRSMLLDMKIILRTAMTVARRTGISAEGHATVAPFTGTETP